MRRLLAVAGGLGALAALLVFGLLGNTFRQGSRQLAVTPEPVEVDAQAIAAVLAEAVAIPTVSRTAGVSDGEALARLRALLELRFPLVHATLERRLVAEHTLIFTWRGADPALPAGVLMAHQDVVPAEEGGWTVPPFEGRVADGFVWGRGTLDDKQNVIAQLSAVENLLRRGWKPRRTVHLVFGHDEETAGYGAEAAARALGAPLAWVLDEGGMVLHDAMDGLAAPAALVGIAEKGYVSLELVATADGGHSSMPPPSTAAGRVARAVARLEENPLPARLSGPVSSLFDAVGPEMSMPMRLVMTNRWLFAPILRQVLSGKPSTNAILRTTTAVTMLSGSDKDNVLPREAKAVVNFRILPGDTIASVTEHVRAVVDDEGLQIRVLEGIGSEPSPVSVSEGETWDTLARAIRETFPDAVVAPFLMVGATDARRFASASEHTWRFNPVRMRDGDLDRLHGVDERVAVEDLGAAAAFYERFLVGAAQ